MCSHFHAPCAPLPAEAAHESTAFSAQREQPHMVRKYLRTRYRLRLSPDGFASTLESGNEREKV
jgi:hypothetical protein